MKTVAIITACFAGCFGGAFLIAAFFDLALLEIKERRRESGDAQPLGIAGLFVALFDAFVLQGALSTIGTIADNWTKKPEARKNACLGAALLLVMGVAIYFSR